MYPYRIYILSGDLTGGEYSAEIQETNRGMCFRFLRTFAAGKISAAPETAVKKRGIASAPLNDELYQILDLSVRSENIYDLMSYHILYSLSCRLQILTRVEVLRMLCEVLADVSCHCETDIRVDVDLAY